MTSFMPQSDSRNDPSFKSLEASRLGPADQKRLTFTDINDWVNITLKQHFRKDVKKVRCYNIIIVLRNICIILRNL